MTLMVKLTSMSRTAGWAAKIGPETLSKILGRLPEMKDNNLMVGIETSDDAAVYKLNEDTAIIQTLDFFYSNSWWCIYFWTNSCS